MTSFSAGDFPLVFDHIERYLGPVDNRWGDTAEGQRSPFQVLRCAGQVIDTTFFCTLGLGNHPMPNLHGPANGVTRHELLIAVPNAFGTRNVPVLLQQLGQIAIKRQRPFTRGEIVMGANPVFGDWPFRGLFASHPFVVGVDAFAECTREDGKHIRFLWLAPIHQREIDYARKHGHAKLEVLFAERNIDLVDLNRPPAVD
ncbi:MAG TPA: suppressor of fused domain protein [Terracidiphilus sp.]|jgi:hypothetical protein